MRPPLEAAVSVGRLNATDNRRTPRQAGLSASN